MANILNKNSLDEIFDIDSEHESFFEVEEITEELAENIEEPVSEETEEEYFLRNMKDMMEDIQGVIGATKYLCDTSPEPETIMAASQMFTSATGLLKEINKSNLQLKKFQFMENQEKMKIEARMKLAEFKALENNKRLSLTNSTINIQQNNSITQQGEVAYCQEDIISEILKQQQITDKSITEDIIDGIID